MADTDLTNVERTFTKAAEAESLKAVVGPLLAKEKDRLVSEALNAASRSDVYTTFLALGGVAVCDRLLREWDARIRRAASLQRDLLQPGPAPPGVSGL